MRCAKHKTVKDPTAGLPIAEERTSSSDGRCQNLIVWIVKVLQVFQYRSQLDLIINSYSCFYVIYSEVIILRAGTIYKVSVCREYIELKMNRMLVKHADDCGRAPCKNNNSVY